MAPNYDELPTVTFAIFKNKYAKSERHPSEVGEIKMIDLEKLAKWSAILSILWLAMWMSHVYTVKIIREDIAELYLDVHEASEEGGLEIESSN